MAIIREIHDPRVEDVTVTYVEVSPDMRMAKVHVSVMGDETKQNLCLHGLRSAAGFLQNKISERIDTRYTPRLRFELDQGVKQSIQIARLLDNVLSDVPEADRTNQEVTDNHSEDVDVDDSEIETDPPQ